MRALSCILSVGGGHFHERDLGWGHGAKFNCPLVNLTVSQFQRFRGCLYRFFCETKRQHHFVLMSSTMLVVANLAVTQGFFFWDPFSSCRVGLSCVRNLLPRMSGQRLIFAVIGTVLMIFDMFLDDGIRYMVDSSYIGHNDDADLSVRRWIACLESISDWETQIGGLTSDGPVF